MIGILLIIVLGFIIVGIGKGALVLLNLSDTQAIKDPMFAEEAIQPTMPTDLFEDETRVYTDQSANWDISVQTPIDKTADELAKEAKEAANAQ